MKIFSPLPTMSRSMSAISINSEILDDITPDDSISRGGIFNQMDDTQDRSISTTAMNITKTSRSMTWNQSNLILVKDDKYESNLEYLEGVMGVFQTLL